MLTKRGDFDSPLPAGSGVAAMGKAYRKYGFPLSDTPSSPIARELQVRSATAQATESLDAPSAGATTSANVIATAQESDAEFLSRVTIGGQSMTMDFDTGSSDLCVAPTLCSLSFGISLLNSTDGSSTQSSLISRKPATDYTTLPNQQHSRPSMGPASKCRMETVLMRRALSVQIRST